MSTIIDSNFLDQFLRKTFGFQAFRPGQREAILTLLDKGKLLCIQPTGHGKSLLYQLPACLLGGLTLVISPLLALMRDQIRHLNERFKIPAAAINSDQSMEQNAQARKEALLGKIRVLFVAPEQLDHVDRLAFLLNLDIRLLVIDEAHCISTWGHDFRPSYRQILPLVKALTEKYPDMRVLGLTATADKRVEEDIKQQLTLSGKDVAVLRETMERPNISLSVISKIGLAEKLSACMQLLSLTDGCGLIYCATRDHVELVAEFLQQKFPVAAYHAGFDPEDKKRLQSEFLADAYKALVATNALGMGIDKGNLRFVIHFDVPGSITAYYQEVGRCGRDGLPAQGFLLFDHGDRYIQEYFINSAVPSPENFTQVINAVKTAEKPPNLVAIKRITGLHPTLVTIIVAELLEQGFLCKKSLDGIQVYYPLNNGSKPNLSRYDNQQKVKKRELQKMLQYGQQIEACRMGILRSTLGDKSEGQCGNCDVCRPALPNGKAMQESAHLATDWLKDRTFPISPIALHKVSPGISILDSKVSSQLFVRFMKERNIVSTYQEMDVELIQLILKQFNGVSVRSRLGGVIPFPSRTWKARDSLLKLISERFNVPILHELLYWSKCPPQRQGELYNNDQRHHNVHRRMAVNSLIKVPAGTLILLDDYIGSGNTFKEASRALRASKSIKNELMPFTIASLQWHLGKPGFS